MKIIFSLLSVPINNTIFSNAIIRSRCYSTNALTSIYIQFLVYSSIHIPIIIFRLLCETQLTCKFELKFVAFLLIYCGL